MNLPDFEALAEVETGTTNKIDLSMKKRPEGFAVIFEGFIDIPENGNFIFFLQSNDESRLLIDDKLIVQREIDYEHREKSGVVSLEKSLHRFKTLYVGSTFKKKLELSVSIKGPGIEMQEVPSSMFFHCKY